MSVLNRIFTHYIDRFGMVKPQEGWKDSGNGILYSTVFVVLKSIEGKENLNYGYRSWYIGILLKCELEPGLYARTPENTYGQQQWDDYLAIAVGCAHIGDQAIPKRVMKYAIKNFFVFNTDGKLEGKDFLLRFPQVWCLMVPLAYPWTKVFMRVVANIVGFFMKPSFNQNASGAQLEWLYFRGMERVFGRTKAQDMYEKKAGDSYVLNTFMNYYGPNHPFTEFMKEGLKSGTSRDDRNQQ